MPLGPRSAPRCAPGPRFFLPSLLLAAALALAPSAHAEDRSGPPRDGGREDLPANRTPELVRLWSTPAPMSATSAGALPPKLLRKPAPLSSVDAQPSVMIDAGDPSAGPTEAERVKLAAARAAVERARLAGTLYRVRAPRAETLPLPTDWETQKRALSRVQAPKPFADDPAAGVGPMPSVQKSGPAGLTPAEEAKRRAPQPSPTDREPNEGGR
jgi:hypothetical protein